MLRRIGTHLEPEDTGGRLNVDAPQDDITVVERLRAEGQTAMNLAVGTVLDKDVLVGAVVLVSLWFY